MRLPCPHKSLRYVRPRTEAPHPHLSGGRFFSVASGILTDLATTYQARPVGAVSGPGLSVRGARDDPAAMVLPPSRSAREALARELRGRGLRLREIADELGVAISTVDSWLNDPGGERLRARKDSYRGRCER